MILSDQYLDALTGQINATSQQVLRPLDVENLINMLYRQLLRNPSKDVAKSRGVTVARCDTGFHVWYERDGKQYFKIFTHG